MNGELYIILPIDCFWVEIILLCEKNESMDPTPTPNTTR